MSQVLAPAQTTSDEWAGIPGEGYIEIGAHAGGTWLLQKKTPDGEWIDISPEPNPFTASGLWWVKFIGPARYRLTGGDAGAKAWVSNTNGLDVETF